LSRNPGPFGGRGSHPSLLLLLPGFSLQRGPRDVTAPLLPAQHASLHDVPLRGTARISGAGFSPVRFRCPCPRLVSCYALFEGWLLLSPPPSCLGTRTPFGIALSRHLGPLMRGWVAFPFARRAYPCRAHSRRLRRLALRSSTTDRVLSDPSSIIGALHTKQARPRPTCE
jgi:hypothetical protein